MIVFVYETIYFSIMNLLLFYCLWNYIAIKLVTQSHNKNSK